MATSNWMKRLGGTLVIGAVATLMGCESVALLPRDDIGDRRGYENRRDSDRRYGDRYDRDLRREQVYGTVQDVNERRREIQIRTDEDRTAIVRYDDNTRISDERGDIRATSLRAGDRVSVRIERSSGGEDYAGSIRLEDRRGSSRGWWR